MHRSCSKAEISCASQIQGGGGGDNKIRTFFSHALIVVSAAGGWYYSLWNALSSWSCLSFELEDVAS